MREILFRAKSNYGNVGEWEYGLVAQPHVTEDGIVTSYYFTKICENGWSSQRTVSENTIGQYTGLTDKNGTKIFEGDIVKCKHDWQNQGRTLDTDEVAFLEQKIRGAYGKYIDKTLGETFRWRYHYFRNYAVEYYVLNGGWRVRNGSCFHSLTQTYITNRDLEVIGNIHDNPELLKGGVE